MVQTGRAVERQCVFRPVGPRCLFSSPGIRPVIAFVCSQEVLFGWHLFGNEETAAHLEGETNVFTS